MKAGLSNLNVGDKVRLSIVGEDKILNGLTGRVTHPFFFGETRKGWVGVELSDEDIDKSPYGRKLNVREKECILL